MFLQKLVSTYKSPWCYNPEDHHGNGDTLQTNRCTVAYIPWLYKDSRHLPVCLWPRGSASNDSSPIPAALAGPMSPPNNP
jgi:hypothetical protein